MVSSARGSGTDTHVDEFLDMIREISEMAGDEGLPSCFLTIHDGTYILFHSHYHFKLLAIYSNVLKAKVLKSPSPYIAYCVLIWRPRKTILRH